MTPAAFEIVGVVSDGRYPDVDAAPEPFFWTSFEQDPSRTLVLHLKGGEGGDAMANILRPDVTLEPSELGT